MKILIVNSAPQTEEFVAPITRILAGAGLQSDTVSYDNIPTDQESYSGVIISASPQGDDIVEDHTPYFQWIKQTDKPVLGICHGHQVIGVMHGADLIRDTQSENEDMTIIIKEDHPLFAGYNKSMRVASYHNDAITLPEGFRLMASSERCRVQAMAHRTKRLYTVQFHAEKNPEIILNFAEIVKNH
jgi:GMP synthase (glutamine-hydrolysing)